MLALIPLIILLACPSVMSVLADPTDTGQGKVYELKVTADSWIANTVEKHNDDAFLSIGHRYGSDAKRAVLKFQDLPSSKCAVDKIRWAKMYMYYEEAYKNSDDSETTAKQFSYTLQVHGLTTDWVESEVTGRERKSNVVWSRKMVGILNGQDAQIDPQACPTTIFALRKQGFIEFDVTNIIRSLVGGLANNGVIVLAVNEAKIGRDLRFTSNSGTASQQAYVNVMCNY
ncbi:hypothetical protein QZH41_004671 [Actinostola sp. cb2023]|nr:hypothetical protein QZH41_004671 [Actinostola sp. cb2023]